MTRQVRPTVQGQHAKSRLQRLLPERQIHLRTEGRVSFYRISSRVQACLLGIALAAGGWASFSSYSYFLHDKVLAAKDGQIANVRLAYRSLLGEVAEYQKKFNAITDDLESNHAVMLGLVEKNAALQQNLNAVSKQLELTEAERDKILTARRKLSDKVAALDTEIRQLSGRNYSLKDNLDTVENDLQVALTERNQALFDGTRMRREIKDLEGRLTGLQESQETSVQRLTDRTLAYIRDAEKVVEMAGLDTDKLIKSDKSVPKGQGGPFIPATDDKMPAGPLKASLTNLDNHLGRWEALQGVMKRLPLAAPLDYYSVTSSFGKRRDPLNKRWSAHYGLDLGSVFRSTVFATAPGVVTYAGWKGKFGRLIEIDHGAGVKTRYGHLHKILVKKGQTVKFRDKIGQLGSSGRSTGAHLHYETVFRGKALNPMKFIKAGRYVFQEQ